MKSSKLINVCPEIEVKQVVNEKCLLFPNIFAV